MNLAPTIGHFIDSHDAGGAETLVIELCRRMSSRGHAAEVYHFGNPWLEEACRDQGVPCLRAPCHRYYTSAATLPLFCLAFARFLRFRRIVVLHSHLFGAVTSASFSTFVARIPHVGTLHDTYTVEERKSRIAYLTLAAKLGTRLVAVSGQMKGYYDGLGGYGPGVVQVISNGVDLERYGRRSARSCFPELQLDVEDVVFICVGRLEEIKGHHDLVAAFAGVRARARGVLIIVGEGPRRTEIERQVEELGLVSSVRVLGQRNDVPALLGVADCFVLPSYSEGLSCSIIEAMASGLPVVATDVGGNRELVVEGVNGFLVPPHDPGRLANRMMSLALDAQARHRCAEASRTAAMRRYSLESMIDKYVALYDQVQARGDRGGVR